MFWKCSAVFSSFSLTYISKIEWLYGLPGKNRKLHNQATSGLGGHYPLYVSLHPLDCSTVKLWPLLVVFFHPVFQIGSFLSANFHLTSSYQQLSGNCTLTQLLTLDKVGPSGLRVSGMSWIIRPAGHVHAQRLETSWDQRVKVPCPAQRLQP